jgi:hypothetical protein
MRDESEYGEVLRPMERTLRVAVEEVGDQLIATLDDLIAEAILTALAANDVRGAHYVVGNMAEALVYRVTEDPAAAWPYVAVVEGTDWHAYLWLRDGSPETVETEVTHLYWRETKDLPGRASLRER